MPPRRGGRPGSIIRDKSKGYAKQTMITRGPGSIRKHRENPSAAGQSWTQAQEHMFGMADSVMIQDYTNEDKFLENLRVRYENNLIYTYIRGVCISVNPYQDLGIYTSELIAEYYGTEIFELPPHLYAVANQAYYAMKEENSDQCILISGESGAGKTEAAKQILQFLASTATDTGRSKKIRDRLVYANPILEAFGNAKTLRNDNSSRFGKYMEVQFDFKGEPIGGKIINYLLEKSRVVRQLEGERNFHVFYMLLAGADDAYKASRGLTGDASAFHYTNQGKIITVDALDDAGEWNDMVEAMGLLEFQDGEREAILDLVTFVLKLGQVEFAAEGDGSRVSNDAVLGELEKLVGVASGTMGAALTVNTIVARGDTLKSPLTADKAAYARDALAKSLFDRAFSWLVGRLNKALDEAGETSSRSTVLGLLDIYGFEILSQNGFEQLCINYCNEKLQQLFIELTLKAEQEEYKKEGIRWEPVDYFNNEVLCQLIESPKNPAGIIAKLDDCCLAPGDTSDEVFLRSLDDAFNGISEYYDSFKSNKKVGRDQFVVKHYAGDVTYTVEGFLDTNNDLLYRDLKAAMISSASQVIKDCFPQTELDSKKRPPTAGTQFRSSMQALMETLMAKSPSYIRCVKPNGEKKANEWDEAAIKHQVKYLGLMENLRVARAGYCYRRPFAFFLNRYKSLCPATWPNWTGGDDKSGVERLIAHLSLPDDEVAIGKTKIFIRNPDTVALVEKKFQQNKNNLVTRIAASWRRYAAMKAFRKLRAAAVIAQKYSRVVLAREHSSARKEAIVVIRKFIKGFIHRKEKDSAVNHSYLQMCRKKWLLALAKALPRDLNEDRWLPKAQTPVYLRDLSEALRKLCYLNMGRKYRLALTDEKRRAMTLKLTASMLFKGKKESYGASVGVPFQNKRVDEEEQKVDYDAVMAQYEKIKEPAEPAQPIYVTLLHKFDRTSYKYKRNDYVILTNTRLIVLSAKAKAKFLLPLADLVQMSISPLSDGVVVLSTPGEAKGDKGDFMFDTPHVIELAAYIAHAMNAKKGVKSAKGEQFHGVRPESIGTKIKIEKKMTPTLRSKKVGLITFATGENSYEIVKDAESGTGKALKVTAPKVADAAGFTKQVRGSLRLRPGGISTLKPGAKK